MLAVRHQTTAATADIAAMLRLAATTRSEHLTRTSHYAGSGQASSLLRQDDQRAPHPGMAGAAVFRAREGERTRLVGNELHGDGLTSLRDQGFHAKRFDRGRVRTVGGVKAEPDALSPRNRR